MMKFFFGADPARDPSDDRSSSRVWVDLEAMRQAAEADPFAGQTTAPPHPQPQSPAGVKPQMRLAQPLYCHDGKRYFKVTQGEPLDSPPANRRIHRKVGDGPPVKDAKGEIQYVEILNEDGSVQERTPLLEW